MDAKKRVLIIEDDPISSQVLKEIVEKQNCEAIVQLDSTKAVETALDVFPDVIMLDIVMPKRDGLEVCRLLKANDLTESIPIIMVTSLSDGKTILEAFERGVFDYVKKPVDELEVIARLGATFKFRNQTLQMQEMAMKDNMTGLYNHGLMIELLEKEWSKSNRMVQDLAYMMLDIDDFKSINDNFGHLAGDSVIVEIARTLEACTRESDLIGRYGGDEYCIILPNISSRDTIMIAERIRSTVEKVKFSKLPENYTVTVSIGIAYKSSNSDMSFDELLDTADGILYRAKHKGRNRIELDKMM